MKTTQINYETTVCIGNIKDSFLLEMKKNLENERKKINKKLLLVNQEIKDRGL